MTPQEERQEIARRLRTLPNDVCAALGEWEREGLIIEANRSDEADYSQIHNALFGCFPPDSMHPCDYEELHNRLADLIDPVCENKQIRYNRESPLEFRNDNFICSSCGETFFADEYHINSPIDWAYCPNCGARVVSCND